MWFKKKVVAEPPKADEPNIVLEVLKELEFPNLDDLMQKALDMQDGIEKENLKKFLAYVKPYMLKALAEGRFAGNTEKLPIDHIYDFDMVTGKVNKLLLQQGIEVFKNYDSSDYMGTPEHLGNYTRYPTLPKDQQRVYISFHLTADKKQRESKY